MKKLALFAASLLYCLHINAQKHVPKVLRIDYLDSVEVIKYNSASHGDTITVELYNFNRSLYDIQGDLTQENMNTDMPDIFSGVALPGFIDLVLPKPSEALSVTEEVKTHVTALDSQEKTIRDQIQNINSAVAVLHKAAHLSNDLGNIYKSCGVAYEEVQKQLIQATNKFTGNTTTDRRQQTEDIKTTLEDAVSSANTAANTIDAVFPLYLRNIKLITRRNDSIVAATTGKPALVGIHNAAKYQNEDLNAHLDSLKTLIAKAATNTETLNTFKKDNKIQLLADAYNKINEQGFTYHTQPLAVSRDKVNLSLTVTAKEALNCNQPSKKTFVRTYYTKGGWKFDFSTGVFFNAGNPDFIRREFRYKSVSESERIIEADNAGTKLLLSVGALAHFYRRTGGVLNWAISPGLSTSTNIDGLNFHLGGSLLAGRGNRLVLTAGATARETKVLDLNYKLGQPYAVSETPDSPPTVKKFPELGWFIALTYNWNAIKS